ncbi:hypothetical protein ACWGY7_14455 [Xanthomonas axonopodis pv. khayae]
MLITPPRWLQSDSSIHPARRRSCDWRLKVRANQESFTRSMVFTEKGLASYSYNGLTDYLSTKEIYELLSLFGVQKTISAIPGVIAKNSIETKIIEGNTQIGPAANRDTYCLINGPQRLCRPEYRSICSQACGP